MQKLQQTKPVRVCRDADTFGGSPAWSYLRFSWGITVVSVLIWTWFACSCGFAAAYPGQFLVQDFGFADSTTGIGDGSRIDSERNGGGFTGPGVAKVQSGVLHLTDKVTPFTIGSFRLPDLDPGRAIRSFDVSFSLIMDLVSGGPAGEGWSLSVGDLPDDNGSGEGGFVPLRGGLTLSFLTRSGAGDESAIEVSTGGIRIGRFVRSFAFGSLSRALLLHWDPSGLDLTYDGRAVFSDLPTPGFHPGPNFRFGWTARSWQNPMHVGLDNLKVVTASLPVVETGGPVISEFVTNNPDYEDEFADKPGWIEILNGSNQSIDLAGWYLTDSKSNLRKWRIPSLILSPYNYYLFFTSGRDRYPDSTGLAHTSFRLSDDKGFVALVKPDGKTFASVFEYGAQYRGVSMGESGANRKRGFLFPPTPGTPNNTEAASFGPSDEPLFSREGGVFSSAFMLSLRVPFNSPSASQIRYTIDRTEPTTNSFLYTAPIPISRTTLVRARIFSPDRLAGSVGSRAYLSIDSTLSNFAGSGKLFESNLPLIILDSFGVDVDGSIGGSRPFRHSHVRIIPPDSTTGIAKLDGPADYSGHGGVHVRGESSAGFEQKSYALELWNENLKDTDAKLLGMSEDSDWVLYGPWSEKTLMRNKLVFDWMLELRGNDGSAPRTRFIELFFNQSRTATSLGYSSYRGIYVLMEKLKRGDERLPIQNLNDKTIDPDLIKGGYIFRKDKPDALKNNWTSSRYGIALQSYDPDRLNTPQLSFLRNYINSFEASLASANFRDIRAGYRAFMDTESFIDAQWMLEIAKQVDGYVFSTYFHKDRGGRIRAGPLWDFNISLGNADYATGDRPTGWLYDVANGVGQNWYPRLHADPDYKIAHWDRYWALRRTVLDTNRVFRVIDAHMKSLLNGYTGGVSNRAPASIQNPVARHFRRWPRLGSRDWPNPAASTLVRTWQDEVNYLRNWLTSRLNWLDDQSMRTGSLVYRPPEFSSNGGEFLVPTLVSMQPYAAAAPAGKYAQGEIYFTLDGSDPRLIGGETNPTAHRYTVPVLIKASTTLKARLFFQRQWSPLAVAAFKLQPTPASRANLLVSEIMYHPQDPTVSERTAGIENSTQFEYIELRALGNSTVDLTGLKVEGGVLVEFSSLPPESSWMEPGASALLVSDGRAFSLRYPGVPANRILGQFRGRLNNGGDVIRLIGRQGDVIQEFRYDNEDLWPIPPLSGGISLVLSQPSALPALGSAGNWRLSSALHGTPGESGGGENFFAGNPIADSDLDGVSDLGEFVTRTDPENPSSLAPMRVTPQQLMVLGRLETHLQIELRLRKDLVGWNTVIEMSSDLRTWVSFEPEIVATSVKENSDGSVHRVYRTKSPLDPLSRGGWFLRFTIRKV